MKVLKRTGSLAKDKAAKQKQERKRRSLGGLFLSPEHTVMDIYLWTSTHLHVHTYTYEVHISHCLNKL